MGTHLAAVDPCCPLCASHRPGCPDLGSSRGTWALGAALGKNARHLARHLARPKQTHVPRAPPASGAALGLAHSPESGIAPRYGHWRGLQELHVPFIKLRPRRTAKCTRGQAAVTPILIETLGRLLLACPLCGIQEDPQGPPQIWETLIRPVTMSFAREATVGPWPTHGGFADPCLSTWLRRRRSHQPIRCPHSASAGYPGRRAGRIIIPWGAAQLAVWPKAMVIVSFCLIAKKIGSIGNRIAAPVDPAVYVIQAWPAAVADWACRGLIRVACLRVG